MSSQDPIMAVSNVGDYLIGSAWGLLPALGVVDVAHSMGKAILLSAKPCPIWINTFHLSCFGIPPIAAIWLGTCLLFTSNPIHSRGFRSCRLDNSCGGVLLSQLHSGSAPMPFLMAREPPVSMASAAISLLLGIVLRPPLMVTGFFAAVILMNVLGRILGAKL